MTVTDPEGCYINREQTERRELSVHGGISMAGRNRSEYRNPDGSFKPMSQKEVEAYLSGINFEKRALAVYRMQNNPDTHQTTKANLTKLLKQNPDLIDQDPEKLTLQIAESDQRIAERQAQRQQRSQQRGQQRSQRTQQGQQNRKDWGFFRKSPQQFEKMPEMHKRAQSYALKSKDENANRKFALSVIADSNFSGDERRQMVDFVQENPALFFESSFWQRSMIERNRRNGGQQE